MDTQHEGHRDPSDTITDLSDGDKIDLYLINADSTTAGDPPFHQVDAFTSIRANWS